MDQEKITQIEIALSHHEQQITEMSDVITDQWKMIDALKRKLDKVMAKMEHSAQGDGGEALDGIERARQDIPPHY